MKLNLTLIFTVCLFLCIAQSALWASNSMQQPQNERQFNNGFKDDYSGRKYNYEGKAKVRTGASNQRSDAEYSDEQPYIKEDNTTNAFSFDFSALNWLFVLILILAVGYLGYTLLNEGSSTLFSSRNKRPLNSYNSITAENIEHADIKMLITNAENTSDYRLAIRYYYLLVLKQLTLNNYIKFEDDKTNADYMNAIASQKFSTAFAYTSYIYNYTWYGEFALDIGQYQMAKNSFVKLINEVNL